MCQARSRFEKEAFMLFREGFQDGSQEGAQDAAPWIDASLADFAKDSIFLIKFARFPCFLLDKSISASVGWPTSLEP